MEKINETKSCFFEKMNEINKPLVRLVREETEKTQTTNIRDEEGDITIDAIDTKKVIREK